ncbi:MarR family transcriptional regulator [Novosphingobium sp. P6W]|nr:MarR family transcriptional regulator [Novosphingobium sp. P6W]KIS32421.1 hypothetical protein TQ38_12460 [Novosphingobium sp. P6W]
MRLLIAPEITLTETQKRILVELRIKGPTPRMVLARELGINTATITRVTQQLTALGLIEERDGSQSTERGRPSVPLAVSGKGAWAVGATVHPGWLERSRCTRPTYSESLLMVRLARDDEEIGQCRMKLMQGQTAV